ncbi:MAG: DUF4296 domain-containing protein [Chitinophagales bacterium]
MKISLHTIFILIVAAAIMQSCRNNSNFSGDHLPPKVMQKVLLDINLAEAYCINVKDSLHRGGSKNFDSLSVYYKDIFAHYKITEEQFTQSITWYKNHPDEMDTVYNNMIPIVARWQSQPDKK